MSKIYKTTIVKNGIKESLSINSNIIKLIKHNAYLMKKYNTFKNDVARPTITTITEYKKLLENGKSKKELYSILTQERKNLEIPKSLKKLQQEINRQKRREHKEERIKSGGIYARYKEDGYKEAKRVLKANLNRVYGYANPLHVDSLITSLEKMKGAYNLLNASVKGTSAFTEKEEKDYQMNINKIKRHRNRFPDKLIPIIDEYAYDLGNGVISPTEFNYGVYMYLSINNIY